MGAHTGITLAIDFGTTKTLISYIDAKGEPRLMRMGRNVDLIPTVAYLQQDGTLLFGDDAEDWVSIDPKNYRRAFKMELGSSDSVLGRYTAQELVKEFLAYLLRRVKDDATMYHASIDNVILTCPVEFSAVQLQQLRTAAAEAGLPEVQLITEPEAAGTAYCFYCATEAFRKNALVVDWGGGTLDVALIARSGKRLQSKKRYAHGNNTMGGEVFDVRLGEHIIGEMADSLDLSNVCWPEFMKQVRALKVNLSSAEVGVLHMVVDKKPVAHKVQRKTFERLIANDVAAVADEVKRFVDSIPADNKPEMLVLVGGTALIPCIRKELEAVTQLDARTWSQAREAVVMGAALLGKSEKKEDDDWDSDPLPTDEFELLNLADQGNPRAQYALAQKYLGDRHEVYAFEWATKAAARNYAPALELLARFYEKGIGTEVDIQKALLFYRRAADDGHAEAMYRLGMGAEKGTIMPTDTAAAADYYRKAAENGHILAMAALGRCYADGVGVQANPGQAYKYLRPAADAGITDAQYRIALYYDKGVSVHQDGAVAEKWYKRAADNNHAEAIYAMFRRCRFRLPMLGLCHRAAIGGCKGAKHYLAVYKVILALLGLVTAVTMLAYCFYSGHAMIFMAALVVYAIFMIAWVVYLITRPERAIAGVVLGVLGIVAVVGGGEFMVNGLPKMADNDWLVSAWNGRFTVDTVTGELEKRIEDAQLTHDQMQQLEDKGYNIPTHLLAKWVRSDNAAAVEALVTLRNFRPDMSTPENKWLLLNAVKGEKVEMVKALVKLNGINVNDAGDNDETPLYSAVGAKHHGLDMVKALVRVPHIDMNKGYKPNEGVSITPLWWAVYHNKKDIVAELLKAGAEVQIGASSPSTKETPLERNETNSKKAGLSEEAKKDIEEIKEMLRKAGATE